MTLANFLNKLFKHDGFILIDSSSNKFIIGKPIKEKPITIKLLDKSLNYKLLFIQICTSERLILMDH